MSYNIKALEIKTKSIINRENNNYIIINDEKEIIESENLQKEEGKNGKNNEKNKFNLASIEIFFIESDDNCSNKSKH